MHMQHQLEIHFTMNVKMGNIGTGGNKSVSGILINRLYELMVPLYPTDNLPCALLRKVMAGGDAVALLLGTVYVKV